jgi:nickel-type superoxide dismutase maturation protease
MRRTRGPRGPLVAVPAVAAAAAAAASIAIARRLMDVVEVRGGSMRPTLLPGDRLVVVRLRRAPRIGDIVLAPDPRDPSRELVKRAVAVTDDGVVLRGDDPARSTDARTFGAVASDMVRWRVAWRVWPARRFGRVR